MRCLNRIVILVQFIIAVCAYPLMATAQSINVVPTARHGNYPTTFLDACLNMNSWPNVRSVTSYLGSFDGDLVHASDATLSTCFTNMRNAGLKLSIEVAAFQPSPGCGLGIECFNQLAPKLDHWISLGVPQMLIRMQEPLTVGRMRGWAFNDIVFQTKDFMQHI